MSIAARHRIAARWRMLLNVKGLGRAARGEQERWANLGPRTDRATPARAVTGNPLSLMTLTPC